MLDLGALVAKLSLDPTDWEGGLERSAGKFSAFSGAVPGWMLGVTGALVAGSIAGGAALFSIGSTFDDVRDTIRVNTTAVGDEFDGLVASAENVGSKVPASFDKIGPTIAALNTRLGLTGTELETVAAQILEAGRMLGEDLNIDTATGALNVFGIAGEDVSGALDTMFQISQATGVGMGDLMSKLQSAGPITQQLGFNFQETAAMIGVMDKAGLDSQSMIGAMQRGLVNLSNPGESAADAFRRVVGEIEGFIASGDQASAMDLAGQVFGTRGAAQFIGALQTGNLQMNDLIASAGLSGDTILGVAADTQDFGEKWDIFVNKMMLALEPIATRVFDGLSSGMQAVSDIAGPAFAWLAENPVLLQVMAAVIGILTLAFIGLTVATWAMNTALLANPITWIVLAVVALIAAIVLLIMNWDAVVAFVTEVWAGFIGWITGVIEGFIGWWTGVWEGFVGWITGLWEGLVGFITDVWQGFTDWIMAVLIAYGTFWINLWTGVRDFFVNIWNALVLGVRIIWDGFVSWITGVVLGFVSFWMGVWSGVSSFFADLWAGIVGFVTNAWGNVMTFLQGIPAKILGVFSGAATWLYNIGRDVLQGLWNGLVSIWNGLVGWIEDIGRNIANAFAGVLGIASPSRVFRQFGINIGQGLIEGLEDIRPSVDDHMGELVTVPPTSNYNSSEISGYNTSTQQDVTIVVEKDEVAEELYELLTKGGK